MKNKIMIKITSLAMLLGICCMLFISCENDIKILNFDKTRYEFSDDVVGYIVDSVEQQNQNVIEFRNEGKVILYVKTSENVETAANVTLTYDTSALDDYNKKNGSSYVAFPEENITFLGNTEVAKGTNQSKAVTVSFTTSETLSSDVTYAIPVKASSSDIQISEENGNFIILVKDFSSISDCYKASGIKIFSCTGDNPLNSLCFTLKNSKKYLIDAVILFSANINYSKENDKVYIYQNATMKHLLDNREKYIKPLQDRGIKVLLGILGNWDCAGISSLSDETSKKFAQEVKATLKGYQLDGVFLDDEYSQYNNPPSSGFVVSSAAAAARLCYEIKNAMPECILVNYAYSKLYSLPAVEGCESGTFVDYALHDYGRTSDLSSNYPGMPKSNMGLYSQQFGRGNFASKSSLEKMRADGYDSNLIFAMDPNKSNFSAQLSAMGTMAETLYDDEIVYDGNPFTKDW